MNLFTKIDRYIDYNNHYSIRKGLETMRQEFDKAVKYKKPEYAREVVKTLRMMYDKLSTHRQTEDYGELSFSQRMMSNKMQEFIIYLAKRLKEDFGVVEVINENPS
jgi:iron-sulfur cluster repair protein YtfE (RIC family)